MEVEISEKQIIFTRLFNAPRELVFEAWTDPRYLIEWWGPKTFTNLQCEIDSKPGGSYRVIMQSPEGKEYPVNGVYLELAKPEYLVFTDIADNEYPIDWQTFLNRHRSQENDYSPFPSVITINFDIYEDKTKLTIRSNFLKNADRDITLELGAAEGWSQCLDCLENLLLVLQF